MGTNKKTLVLSDLRGGQNGTDPPLNLPDNQVVSAVDVEYWLGGLGSKRGGCASVSTTFSSGGPFNGAIYSLLSYVPAAGMGSAELWAVSDDHAGSPTYVIGRLAGATTWKAVTPQDAPQSSLNWVGASLDNRFFVAYNSAQNRLHLWDGTTFRRVGMATSAAATVADTGSGTYAATIRYYKITYAELDGGGTIIRRGEASPSVTFTPSGSGTAARVTKPATVSENETHWELWASADNLVYYKIATTSVGTSTYDDSTLPSAYSGVTGTLIPTTGENTAPPSAKYVVTDGNRLVMAGAFETSGGYTTPKTSRVWFTPVLGASDIGDAERVPPDHYLDLGENDGDAITGLAAHDGAIYVFKLKSTWKLIPTGNSAAPYQPSIVSRSIGCLGHNTIVSAEDEYGNPALYFLSMRGAYRIGVGGVQYCGRDNEYNWNGSRTNIIGTRDYAHAVYYAEKHQVWFWVPTGGPGVYTLWVFDTAQGRPGAFGIRGGWSKFTGVMAGCGCSAMFAKTVSTTMSVEQNPYMGHYTGIAPTAFIILKGDSGTQDITTDFAGLITTKAYALGGLGRNFGTGSPILIGGKQTTATTITVGMIRDFGVETTTGTVTLTAGGSETTVIKKVEGLDNASCGVVQFTIGDGSAANVAWTLDALVVPYDVEEPR